MSTVARRPQAPGREQVLEALLDGAWRPLHPYAKWRGVFWRLASAVDLGVDPARDGVRDMVEAVLDWLAADERQARPRAVEGRVRWCASQDGLGLWSAVRLGYASDPRARRLAAGLTSWQWPDGGWNCDRRPEARHASFHETHAPLRALAAYHRVTGDEAAGEAAQRAADFLLEHRLYRSCRTGEVVHPELTRLHWPPYWHYDVLAGLRGVVEAGRLDDPRAAGALDLLRAAQRPDGTWRTSGRRYWRARGTSGTEVADLSVVAHAAVTEQAAALLQAP